MIKHLQESLLNLPADKLIYEKKTQPFMKCNDLNKKQNF